MFYDIMHRPGEDFGVHYATRKQKSPPSNLRKEVPQATETIKIQKEDFRSLRDDNERSTKIQNG